MGIPHKLKPQDILFLSFFKRIILKNKESRLWWYREEGPSALQKSAADAEDETTENHKGVLEHKHNPGEMTTCVNIPFGLIVAMMKFCFLRESRLLVSYMRSKDLVKSQGSGDL